MASSDSHAMKMRGLTAMLGGCAGKKYNESGAYFRRILLEWCMIPANDRINVTASDVEAARLSLAQEASLARYGDPNVVADTVESLGTELSRTTRLQLLGKWVKEHGLRVTDVTEDDVLVLSWGEFEFRDIMSSFPTERLVAELALAFGAGVINNG